MTSRDGREGARPGPGITVSEGGVLTYAEVRVMSEMRVRAGVDGTVVQVAVGALANLAGTIVANAQQQQQQQQTTQV